MIASDDVRRVTFDRLWILQINVFYITFDNRIIFCINGND